MIKRYNEVEEMFKRADRWVNYLKKKNRLNKGEIRFLYWTKLFYCDNNEVDEYMKTRDLEHYFDE